MSASDRLYRELAAAALISGIIIAGANMLMLYDFGKEHSMQLAKYAVYGVIASFPMVVVVSAIYRYLSHLGNAEYFLIPKSDKERKILRIKKGESLLLDATPHPMYFLKLAIAVGMLMFFIIGMSLFNSEVRPLEDGVWWWKVLLSSGITALIVYSMSADLLPHQSYLESVEHAWALFLAFWWALTAVAVLKTQIEIQYPRAFWEDFFGLPSMAMMMFALILFLLSSMIWRVDSYLSGRKGATPLATISITFMGAGIAAIFPPMWFMFSDAVRGMFFYAVMIISFVLWILLAVFLYYKGGMKFIFTSQRIITMKKFLGVDVNEHPYDSIISVELHQGILGRHFNYGDLRFRIKRGKKTVSFSVHGVKNPVLVKNTVMALRHKKHRKKSKKKKNRKRPGKPPGHVDDRRVYHLKPY